MDKDSILAEMKLINDAVESGVIQDIKAAQAQYNALSAQLAKLGKVKKQNLQGKMLM
jgi:hypothetical protein